MDDWRIEQFTVALKQSAAKNKIIVRNGSVLRSNIMLKMLLNNLESAYKDEFGHVDEDDYDIIKNIMCSPRILKVIAEPGSTVKGLCNSVMGSVSAETISHDNGDHSVVPTYDGAVKENGEESGKQTDNKTNGNSDNETDNETDNGTERTGTGKTQVQSVMETSVPDKVMSVQENMDNNAEKSSDESDNGNGDNDGSETDNGTGSDESETDNPNEDYPTLEESGTESDNMSFTTVEEESETEVEEEVDPNADYFPEYINGWRCYPKLLRNYYKPYFWDKLMKLATTKLTEVPKKVFNVMLWGDAGLGKTEVAHSTAKYLFGHDGAVAIIAPDSTARITGHYNLNDEYVPSELITAMQKEGVLLIDEAALMPDLIQPHMNTFLNNGYILVRKHRPIKNPDGTFKTDAVSGKPVVEYYMEKVYRHPNCLVFLCDNTNGEGGREGFERYPIDKSVKDRMVMINEIKWETKVAKKIGGFDRTFFAEEWNRACHNAAMPTHIVSYRALSDMKFEELAELDLKEVVRDCFFKDMVYDDILTVTQQMSTSIKYNKYGSAMYELLMDLEAEQ